MADNEGKAHLDDETTSWLLKLVCATMAGIFGAIAFGPWAGAALLFTLIVLGGLCDT